MPRADTVKTANRTEIRALQQSDFPSSRQGLFEIQAPLKTMLVQIALTDYHHQEIQSHLSRRPLPTRKQNES